MGKRMDRRGRKRDGRREGQSEGPARGNHLRPVYRLSTKVSSDKCMSEQISAASFFLPSFSLRYLLLLLLLGVLLSRLLLFSLFSLFILYYPYIVTPSPPIRSPPPYLYPILSFIRLISFTLLHLFILLLLLLTLLSTLELGAALSSYLEGALYKFLNEGMNKYSPFIHLPKVLLCTQFRFLLCNQSRRRQSWGFRGSRPQIFGLGSWCFRRGIVEGSGKIL